LLGLHLEAADAIRQVLWRRWDPIGVNSVPEASDEYDGYAGGVLRMFLDGATDAEIAQHLLTVETTTMGLSRPTTDERRLAVAREVRRRLSTLGVL